jgi:hypothetical protein
LRAAEVRILASGWKVATLHLEKPPPGAAGPTDLVLGYRNRKRIEALAERSGERLRVVDAESAYFRLMAKEMEPLALFETLRELLRL